MNKILSISLMDSTVLQTAKVNNVHLIPSYILIAKKMENMGDDFFAVAQYLEQNKKIWAVEREKCDQVLHFFRDELRRCVRHILSDYKEVFTRAVKEKLDEVKKDIANMKDVQIRDHFNYCFRYLLDIEDQIIGCSFYKKLVREKLV